jgi:GTP-binding protein EngB required for normal cell division
MLTARKKLVKTSQTPGKTQLINFFLINETTPAPVPPSSRTSASVAIVTATSASSSPAPASASSAAANPASAFRPFYLVDIPGFGYASKGGEVKRRMEEAIEAYFRKSRSLAGLIYLIDCRIPDSEVDAQALDWLADFEHPLLVVATKSDKLGKQELNRNLAAITARYSLPQPPIVTSSEKRMGRAELLEQLELLLADPGQGV